ncbi:hypothetical protein CEXT_463841 [Caerostris extrusa]|uniref:Uncharacterized protein n=1 Tax=Caerostris extrusa TaxID=172846 RepID=A0AAV4NV69_CAEEX|nr:hypothetical protein CEXT_463841 [Caerostris extrusa]
MALRVPVFVYTDGELDLGSNINGAFIHSIVDAPSGCCRRRKWKREGSLPGAGKKMGSGDFVRTLVIVAGNTVAAPPCTIPDFGIIWNGGLCLGSNG